MTKLNRRQFMAGSVASFAGATGILGALGSQKAWSADTSGYKALVCVFLLGGLDHADTVLPTDEASYDLLAGIRPGLFNSYGVGSGTSSRDRQNLLGLNPLNTAEFGGRTFGLPAQLSPLREMFNAGELAIVGNVGPLLEPTERTSFEAQSVNIPPRLFSHNDQQSTWMALGVEGTRLGWGGRFADATIAADPSSDPLFAAITASSNDVFLAGEQARQFQAVIGGDGAVGINIYERTSLIGGSQRFNAARTELEQFFARQNLGHENLFAQDLSRVSADGIANTGSFNAAIENAMPVSVTFPDTTLGRQLQAIAQAIDVRNEFNVNRQVFYATMGGFDTHSGQADDIPELHTQIAEAFAAFRSALIERNVWNDVTLFTASDFGRTTIDNGDGTDHGWGGHHFVMGGSVAGQRIYGDLPPADLDLPIYTESRGRLIPSTSVEQYAATLGKWFGLDEAEIAVALPNLSQFGAEDLGFMG